MFPSRLDVTFDSNLLDNRTLPDRFSAALGRLGTELRERLPRQTATVEFALIVFWALSPFALAVLIS